MASPVRRLPADLSRFVRAGCCICSFHQAVEEVVLNAIDAHCSSVEITLDLETFSFRVLDDGKSSAPAVVLTFPS
jgi:DNA mismatch repair ATPase MutL